MDQTNGGSSLRIVKRQNRSTSMHMLHILVRPFRPNLVKPNKHFPTGSPRLTPSSNIHKMCRVKEWRIEDVYIYDLRSQVPQEQYKQGPSRRIYYFAGGGWQMPPSSQHWKLCAELCRRLPNTVVSLVSYPLAPSSPASASVPLLQKLYATLLKRSKGREESVVFAGDSSGGNIVLCLTLHALMTDREAPHPHALLVISPAVDLRPKTREGALETVNKSDPILTVDFINSTAKAWTADSDPANTWISPINADVKVLAKAGVKLYGITGGYDVLTPDALVFRDNCKNAGVEGEWLEWDKQMHCFPLAWIYGLPESRDGKDWIIDTLLKYT